MKIRFSSWISQALAPRVHDSECGKIHLDYLSIHCLSVCPYPYLSTHTLFPEAPWNQWHALKDSWLKGIIYSQGAFLLVPTGSHGNEITTLDLASPLLCPGQALAREAPTATH